jgi:hypothetical protein
VEDRWHHKGNYSRIGGTSSRKHVPAKSSVFDSINYYIVEATKKVPQYACSGRPKPEGESMAVPGNEWLARCSIYILYYANGA